MNSLPVIKLSSLGRDRASDVANLRYISRFGTAEDQSGKRVLCAEAGKTVKKYYEQIGLNDGQKNSFRVIVSLPLDRTDEARAIVRHEIARRYGSYIVAGHDKNDRGEAQPHLHFLVFNDREHHPLRRHKELRDLRETLGQRFEAAGISFSPSKRPEKNISQGKFHAKDREEIERAMKEAVTFATAGNAEDFDERLDVLGVKIARETKSGTITLVNNDGYKCRLSKITGGKMATREDVTRYLHEQRRHTMDETTKQEKLQELQKAYAVAYERRAKVLAAAGLNAEAIEKKLGRLDQDKEPFAAIKSAREHLYNTMSTEKLREAERAIEAKEKGLKGYVKGAPGISVSDVSQLLSGNPLPLIMKVIQATAALAEAGHEFRKNTAPLREISKSNTAPVSILHKIKGLKLSPTDDNEQPETPHSTFSPKGPGG